LITEAISAGATSAALVDVLASIGTDTARTALERATRAPPEVAAAAEQALRTLDEIGRQRE
jgi:DNA-binding TFAR19-related protein (PDSD5 family)